MGLHLVLCFLLVTDKKVYQTNADDLLWSGVMLNYNILADSFLTYILNFPSQDWRNISPKNFSMQTGGSHVPIIYE